MNMLLKILLSPFGFIYGTVVWWRNRLFDYGIFKSAEFKFPVISIGNITVGGTGKTPHTEYLIELLKKEFHVAVLSRGYKRKSKGFKIAGENSTFEEIGDEPLQMKQKFPEITVAVDKNRVNGINKIMGTLPETDIILLDDAYQHRKVTPGINILLTDYSKPLAEDQLLPVGRLREPASEKRRADIIIISKTPKTITAIEKRLLLLRVGAKPHQNVYFSYLSYDTPVPVFKEKEHEMVDFENKELSVLLVTGIANPWPLEDMISQKYKHVEHLNYPDHYSFSDKDIEKIEQKFSQLPGDNKILLTTEKDAVRLLNFEYKINTHSSWFYLPIRIEFHDEHGESFNHQILHYVRNNSRNSLLYKKNNKH